MIADLTGIGVRTMAPAVRRYVRGGGAPLSLLDALSVYWRYDVAPAGVTPDASGNGNTLLITGGAGGGTIQAAGKINGAFEPANSTDVALGTAAGTVLAATDSFTLTAWFKATVGFISTFTHLLGRAESLAARDYRLSWTPYDGFTPQVVDTNGKTYSLRDNSLFVDTTGTVWFFAAFGYDFALQQLWFQLNAGTRLALSGVPNVRATQPHFSVSNTGVPINDGFYTTAPCFVDESGFWKRSLSTGEISTLYGAGTPPDFSTFGSHLAGGAGAATTIINPVGTVNLKTGLVAYWTMDDASNASRLDSVGTNHLLDHNSNLAAAYAVTEKGAVMSSGLASNGLVATSSAPFVAGAGKSFTIAGWVKNLGFVNTAPIVGKWNAAPNGYLLWNNAGNVQWLAVENGTLTNRTLTVATTAAWGLSIYRHVVVGYDSALQQLWYQFDNGARTTTPCADVNADANNFVFGNYASLGDPTDAGLDEFGFWNRTLTTAEVNALFFGARYNSF